jgi:hypothetical protein
MQTDGQIDMVQLRPFVANAPTTDMFMCTKNELPGLASTGTFRERGDCLKTLATWPV